MQETWVQSLGQEDPLKEEMATYSSILAGEIQWTEPEGLQSMGSQRVGHAWEPNTFKIGSEYFKWSKSYFKISLFYYVKSLSRVRLFVIPWTVAY